jgi:peroxiredoxin-like protein
MQPFPHHYTVSAAANGDGDVALSAERLPPLASAPPAEFDGPGDRWSPETLVVGAVADCFVLTFRAIAKLSKLRWTTLTCEASGTVDRVDRISQFTAFSVRVLLEIPEGASNEQAHRLLERAEQACLITNSLKAPCHLETAVHVAEPTTGMLAGRGSR